MKSIKEVRDFEFPTTVIWDIISDISRCDWVPGVESIELEGNRRIFKMSGMGRLVEEILECNDSKMELTYSAIETMAPIGHSGSHTPQSIHSSGLITRKLGPS